jgi:hypothetical protein
MREVRYLRPEVHHQLQLSIRQLLAVLALLGVSAATVASAFSLAKACVSSCSSPQFLRKLAPPSDPYLHNDLHVREAPEYWPGGHAAWSAQEPENAHSHLLSMVIGNSETVPVTKGQLALGTWQVRPNAGVACLAR